MTLNTSPNRASSFPTKSSDYRQVLSHFATGVSVVTARDREPVGMAVNAFTSVSLDPPMVAFCAAASSRTWSRIRAARSFAVNILQADQQETCLRFSSQVADRFAGCDWQPGITGSPILEDALAWVECDIEAEHVAGDHVIVIGRVRDLEARSGDPLLFFRSGYGKFVPGSNQ